MGSHAAVAAELLKDRTLVDAVLDDYASAPISNQDKALFALMEKVNRNAADVSRADVVAATSAGWSEEAVYDAITVCALFKFYNTWVDATGVEDMPAAAYAMAGQRLATRGYRLPDESPT